MHPGGDPSPVPGQHGAALRAADAAVLGFPHGAAHPPGDVRLGALGHLTRLGTSGGLAETKLCQVGALIALLNTVLSI